MSELAFPHGTDVMEGAMSIVGRNINSMNRIFRTLGCPLMMTQNKFCYNR